jgi:uncharacterized membrane protein YccF (DUF307 family)
MAAFGNFIWFILGGGIWALIWLLMAGIFAITIIGLPLARACLEFAKLAACPFGKEIIRDTELLGKNNVSAITKTINVILGIIWFPLGLILTIAYFALAIACFVSIIGIPFGIAYVRIGKFVLFPMGARVVSKKQAYAIATANEMAKRTNTAEVQNAEVQSDNTQLAPAAAFSKKTGIIIAVGVIIALLVYVLIDVFYLLTEDEYTFKFDIWHIIAIIGCGIFGLLAGIICQKFVLGKKENGILKNVVFVFLITFVLRSLLSIIASFLTLSSIFFGRFSLHFFRFVIERMVNFLVLDLREGLITGIICSLSTFIWLKWRMKKDVLPVYNAPGE